jgi:glutathione S-transferase
MFELYHDWDSVCSVKVRFCLEEKGVDWIDRRLDLCAYEHITPDYLKLNPNGVVPTLVHDGRPVIESSVINEYIDEVVPAPALKPADPLARAKMRAWVKFEDDALHPSIRPASYALMIKPVVASLPQQTIEQMVRLHPNRDRAANWLKTIKEPVDSSAVAAARSKADAALDRMEGELVQNGPWLAGETFSLADIACAPMIDRMEWLMMAALWSHRPALSDWIERIKARKAYHKAFPDRAHRLPGPLNPAEGSLYPGAGKVVIPSTAC